MRITSTAPSKGNTIKLHAESEPSFNQFRSQKYGAQFHFTVRGSDANYLVEMSYGELLDMVNEAAGSARPSTEGLAIAEGALASLRMLLRSSP